MTDLHVCYWSANPDQAISARDYWDEEWLSAIFRGDLGHHPYDNLIIHEGRCESMPIRTGAVVIIPARHNIRHVRELNKLISNMPWVVIVLCGDEASVFPYHHITRRHHDSIKLWVQTPKLRFHAADEDLIRWVGDMWAPGTLEALREIPYVEPDQRTYDIAFSGQVNNGGRKELIVALDGILADGVPGYMVDTGGFTMGLPRDEYVRLLADTRIAPAPSGSMTPDTFRVFEALCAGAVPIVEDACAQDPTPGYWERLLGPDHPIPSVAQWSELPDLLPALLDNWQIRSAFVQSWWLNYRRNIRRRFLSDIASMYPTPPSHLSDVLTVIVTASHIPSHPSTEILDETLASIYERLPGVEVLVCCDGLKSDASKRVQSDYAGFLDRFVTEAARRLPGPTTPLLAAEHVHQANMVNEALKVVDTPLVLIVEHDAPLIGHIDFEGVCRAVLSGDANIVRFHHEASVLDVHRHLMIGGVEDLHGIPAWRTWQFSARPHVASADWYRIQFAKRFDLPRERYFFEDRLHQHAEIDMCDEGKPAWDRWRMWIYHPADVEGAIPGIKRSTHTDGRAGAKKALNS